MKTWTWKITVTNHCAERVTGASVLVERWRATARSRVSQPTDDRSRSSRTLFDFLEVMSAQHRATASNTRVPSILPIKCGVCWKKWAYRDNLCVCVSHRMLRTFYYYCRLSRALVIRIVCCYPVRCSNFLCNKRALRGVHHCIEWNGMENPVTHTAQMMIHCVDYVFRRFHTGSTTTTVTMSLHEFECRSTVT